MWGRPRTSHPRDTGRRTTRRSRSSTPFTASPGRSPRTRSDSRSGRPMWGASRRKGAMIGVENAYPLGEDLKNIKAFYDRGGRYLSLAHNGHSQWSDSNNGEASGVGKWNGLSPLEPHT